MFEDVEKDLRYLRDYLASVDDPGTRIAPALVTYALILIHAKLESAIQGAIRERCSSDDLAIDSYVASTVHKSVRSIIFTELGGVLGQFDAESKRLFKKFGEESEVAVQFYNNLETNRQSVAHGGTSTATINEVLIWFLEARKVVLEFREALGLL